MWTRYFRNVDTVLRKLSCRHLLIFPPRHHYTYFSFVLAVSVFKIFSRRRLQNLVEIKQSLERCTPWIINHLSIWPRSLAVSLISSLVL